MKLLFISPNDLPDTLSIFYPKIEAATDYSVGKYKGADIIRLIASGNMQLWAAYDEDKEKVAGIAITEIAYYPQRKICRFLCATGEDLSEWVGLMDGMENWAIGIGCDGFQAECRPGWERVLKDKGYRKSHVILGKDVGNGSMH